MRLRDENYEAFVVQDEWCSISQLNLPMMTKLNLMRSSFKKLNKDHFGLASQCLNQLRTRWRQPRSDAIINEELTLRTQIN